MAQLDFRRVARGRGALARLDVEVSRAAPHVFFAQSSALLLSPIGSPPVYAWLELLALLKIHAGYSTLGSRYAVAAPVEYSACSVVL